MQWPCPLWIAVIVLLASVVVWLLAVWLHTRFWMRRLHLGLPYARVETFEAPDGGKFELRRLEDFSAAPESGPPVLLVHGICANHRNQDIHPKHSLARYLSRHGRDVWILTLRTGRRESWLRASAPMGFDTMVRHDLPWAVKHVLQVTGASAVDYVAFSMGGMLLYASFQKTLPQSAIRRAAFVGSPGRIVPYYPLPRFIARIPRSMIPKLPSGIGGRVLAFLSEWFDTPLHRQIVNPRNLSRGITRLALVDCVEDLPGELLADFIAWATDGGVVRYGGTDILESIHQASCPALFIAGAADRIGPVAAVKAAYEAWGTESASIAKSFVVLGREAGTVDDYGHGDLAMGTRLDEELHPKIEAFLAEPEPN